MINSYISIFANQWPEAGVIFSMTRPLRAPRCSFVFIRGQCCYHLHIYGPELITRDEASEIFEICCELLEGDNYIPF